MSTWRNPSERDQLVERLIQAERRARVAEMKCRVLLGSDDEITILAARVVELEGIVEKLNTKLMQRRKAG